MRIALTADAVRAAEAPLLAMLPDGTLMGRAAFGLAVEVDRHLRGASGRRVLVVAGTGDNAGDALHAGALLARRGARVEAIATGQTTHERGLAALRAAGGRLVRDLAEAHPRPDVVLDGVAGIGGRGGLRPDAAAVFARFAGVDVVAVDVPTGIGVDSGELPDQHVRAALTVAFGALKPAHLVEPAASACGRVVLVDIGLEPFAPAVTSLERNDVAALLPRPEVSAHKYTRGVVGVRAGSPQYPGAGLLALAGANNGLAGMVRHVDGSASLSGLVVARFPEVLGDGRAQAWVVGPGGGEHAAAMLDDGAASGVPLVVDADALRVLAERRAAGRPTTLPAGSVLTPHAGEAAALLGVDRAAVEAAPLRHARTLVAAHGCVVLLKGPRTLVAEPGGGVRANPTGNAWLGTAGAGDVLAGLVGALLAAGLPAFDAASVGAWLHGEAAVRAGVGGPVVAGDVAREIPHLLREIIAGTEQSDP